MRKEIALALPLCCMTPLSAWAEDGLVLMLDPSQAIPVGGESLAPVAFQDVFQPYIAPRASTLGLGLEVGSRVTEQFGLRVNGNALSLDGEFDLGGSDYDTDLSLATGGVLLDWHPSGDGFYLSGGAYWNGNEASFRPSEDRPLTIGGMAYGPDDVGSLTGRAHGKAISPYVGLGYRGAVSDGFSIDVEAGVLYTGSVDVDLEGADTIAPADLAEERNRIQDDLSGHGLYPVLTIKGRIEF